MRVFGPPQRALGAGMGTFKGPLLKKEWETRGRQQQGDYIGGKRLAYEGGLKLEHTLRSAHRIYQPEMQRECRTKGRERLSEHRLGCPVPRGSK